eukprot:comp21120_c0_seq1/m.44633 comp21120_c0_seq1/g.44633  ORF comp21120_c0_seq1/g.44633 comp21120_c0_seq1/m.44633 type:complete len:555 (+) comp21120_c0_seq1:71-1735(+)
MHGVKRGEISVQSGIDQCTKYRQLFDGFVSARNTPAKTHTEVLEASGKLLGLNPEVYSAWATRRAVLLAKWSENTSEREADLKTELKLTMDALKQNPKSYWIWGHRQWAVSQYDAERTPELGPGELAKCAALLNLDERNFHCWAYRSWIMTKFKINYSLDFDYTQQKVIENFSNYSAWHRRSAVVTRKYFPALLQDNNEAAPAQTVDNHEFLYAEVEMLTQAFFTEPNDQSVSFYYKWILSLIDMNEFSTAPENAAGNNIASLELDDNTREFIVKFIHPCDHPERHITPVLFHGAKPPAQEHTFDLGTTQSFLQHVQNRTAAPLGLDELMAAVGKLNDLAAASSTATTTASSSPASTATWTPAQGSWKLLDKDTRNVFRFRLDDSVALTDGSFLGAIVHAYSETESHSDSGRTAFLELIDTQIGNFLQLYEIEKDRIKWCISLIAMLLSKKLNHFRPHMHTRGAGLVIDRALAVPHIVQYHNPATYGSVDLIQSAGALRIDNDAFRAAMLHLVVLFQLNQQLIALDPWKTEFYNHNMNQLRQSMLVLDRFHQPA